MAWCEVDVENGCVLVEPAGVDVCVSCAVEVCVLDMDEVAAGLDVDVLVDAFGVVDVDDDDWETEVVAAADVVSLNVATDVKPELPNR